MFVIGYNMVGYLPEMDPYAVETWEDAKSAMLDELERSANFYAMSECDDDEIIGVLGEFEDMIVDLTTSDGPEWGDILMSAPGAQMSYWINQEEGSADEYNEGLS